jgi:hypothetical protein
MADLASHDQSAKVSCPKKLAVLAELAELMNR